MEINDIFRWLNVTIKSYYLSSALEKTDES
jgi:hypothetical protein